VTRPAVILIGPSGLAVGARVARMVEGDLHGLGGRVDAAVPFEETGAHLRRLFREGRPIIGICAAGVLIRALAPQLSDKHGEPPVLAVAEDGSAVVPLLGGHHGANDLARRIAEGLGARAAITTAGDLRFGVALDAPPPGWRLGNPSAAKSIMASLLRGQPVAIENETAVGTDWLAGLPTTTAGADRRILITERRQEGVDALVLHPATLVLGIGCERLAPPAEAIALAESVLADAGLSPLSLACVASIDLKAAEPAVHAVATRFGVPARFFPASRLAAEGPRLATPSELVFRETGCHGVAEGAALAGVGPAGRLVIPKRRGGRCTVALAAAPAVLDPAKIGRARGHLAIVGFGPGSAGGRTAEAEAALSAATDWVGYRLYLDLLQPLAAGKAVHAFDLGAEEKRVAYALDLAASGRRVALISSGDAGIYAMGSLVFELIERGARPDWARIEIQGLAGVSAMQAAAARIGAPLGHDFCAISLSDLLTPWTAIERRLQAAAAGDFVVALYNPVSQRRRSQLALAREILLRARPAETPVVLGRNLGRAGEELRVTTLAALDPDEVDMLTVVLIGAGATRRLARPDGGEWVYTPRGYGDRPEDGTS
jgi:cobalt-precorrin 5A hydrolase/precorrin-3B C17-methyltransferase